MGNEHVFDVGLATNGTDFTALGTLAQFANKQGYPSTITDCHVGIIGDSITDGAYSSGWTANPTDASGNLSSTNYNHNLNGGSYSWFRIFTDCLNMLSDSTTNIFKGYNCASSGKALATGWGMLTLIMGSSRTPHMEKLRLMFFSLASDIMITVNYRPSGLINIFTNSKRL